MPTIKETCPSCGKPEGVSLVWGDLDLLDKSVQDIIRRGEKVCGGDAISIDLAERQCIESALFVGRNGRRAKLTSGVPDYEESVELSDVHKALHSGSDKHSMGKNEKIKGSHRRKVSG